MLCTEIWKSVSLSQYLEALTFIKPVSFTYLFAPWSNYVTKPRMICQLALEANTNYHNRRKIFQTNTHLHQSGSTIFHIGSSTKTKDQCIAVALCWAWSDRIFPQCWTKEVAPSWFLYIPPSFTKVCALISDPLASW